MRAKIASSHTDGEINSGSVTRIPFEGFLEEVPYHNTVAFGFQDEPGVEIGHLNACPRAGGCPVRKMRTHTGICDRLCRVTRSLGEHIQHSPTCMKMF